MDIILCLAHLGFMDTGEQPAPDCATYAAMLATWRHPIKAAPNEVELLAVWPALKRSNLAVLKIAELELTVTARRLREVALGDAVAIAFIQGVETKIAIERAKL